MRTLIPAVLLGSVLLAASLRPQPGVQVQASGRMTLEKYVEGLESGALAKGSPMPGGKTPDDWGHFLVTVDGKQDHLSVLKAKDRLLTLYSHDDTLYAAHLLDLASERDDWWYFTDPERMRKRVEALRARAKGGPP